ncbi:hypothetical protein EK21DRAFT_58065 [Setomelanomma holmii]|uniref:Rhodopsin domain-containing protein n=1 Tax=Setomelanomma holmii TaxID=210430 RepID=A0A9P4HFF7_9PLEO|nr:hypothetical protein EK21DRAFT_58065 [Setomelanomma holmii]
MSSDGQARQDLVTGVSIALTVISAIIVSLRVYTRSLIVRNLGKDDISMVIALVFTFGYLAALLVLRQNGMGYSGKYLTFNQMVTTIKVILVVEIIYYLCVNAIKISILFFYLRLAVERTFGKICKGTIYFLATFCTICIIVVLAQCMPLHKLWDFTGLVQGHCINSTAFFYTTSSTNIIIDIFILVLPIKLLLSIQRPGREKIALLGVFALGTFSCIASIVRLYSVRIYTESKDPFFDSVAINTWSMVEINIGIWCASIPALKALFSKAQRERTQHASGYQYHGTERSGISASRGRNGTPGLGSMGTIIKNEEFVLETVKMERGEGSRERIVRM